MATPHASGPLRRLLAYARPHRSKLRRACAWSVLKKVFDLAPPALIGAAIDVVVEREHSFMARLGVADPTHQIALLTLLTALIWGAESLFQYLAEVRWRNLAQDLQHELRLDAYARVQDMELAFFEDRSTGGLMSILNDDVNQLERFLDVGANEILQITTTVLVIGVAFFFMAPEVAWIAVLPMPIVLWGSFAFQRRLAPRYARVREKVGDLNADLAGHLGGIATIKSFAAEDRERARIGVVSEAYRSANAEAIRLSSAFTPLIRLVILTSFAATLGYGGLLALEGRLAVSIYSVMVFLTQRLLWPLTGLGQVFDLYQRAMASTTRILDLLDARPSIAGGNLRRRPENVAGELCLRGVGFRYKSGGAVFEGLDLTIPAGETTAFVGSTGAGKTTLVKLLLRFYDPTEGSITLDGTPLVDLELASLRRAVGLVGQDVFLFHGSVRDNVAYARPQATEEELWNALRLAEAEAFVRALPRGIDTVVGERGQKLSGGQRQRLSIARAVLDDPPILILDEATSSVDNETEAAIQRSLAQLALDRTVIVIAHRLSTIRHAHTIHVLKDGRIRESGRHEELVESAGSYAALWRVQTGLGVAAD